MEKQSWNKYVRRRDTLKKKASELSSLCDVQVCVLCFGPGSDVATWPEDPSEARAAVESYRRASAQIAAAGNRRRREEKLDLSDLLDSEIKALREQLSEPEPEPEPAFLLDQRLDLLPKESLLALSGDLESKIQAIDRRIGFLGSQGSRSSDDDHDDAEFAALVENFIRQSSDHRSEVDWVVDGGDRLLLDNKPWFGN